MRSYIQGMRPTGKRSVSSDQGLEAAGQTSQASPMPYTIEDFSEPAAYRSQPCPANANAVQADNSVLPRLGGAGATNRNDMTRLGPIQSNWSSGDITAPYQDQHVSATSKTRSPNVTSAPRSNAQQHHIGPVHERPYQWSGELQAAQTRPDRFQPSLQHAHIQPSVTNSSRSDPSTVQRSSDGPTPTPAAVRAGEVASNERSFSQIALTSSGWSNRRFSSATFSTQSESHGPNRHLRQGKTKLNLFNPKNLLARRRSHQVDNERLADRQQAPAPQLPDDFDPSIRGKVVHDFSAPRLTPNMSHSPAVQHIDGERDQWNRASQDEKAVTRRPNPHSPVFIEQFEDRMSKSQGPAKQSPASLQQAAVQSECALPDVSALPEFARRSSTPEVLTSSSSGKNSPSEVRPLDVVPEIDDAAQPKAQTSTSSSPRYTPSYSSSFVNTPQDALAPKRYKSNASRFSFDLAGIGSAAQEKLLEDRHREKSQKGPRHSLALSDTAYDDEFDLALEDDAADMFEEQIPGVNCDDEDDAAEAAEAPSPPQKDVDSLNVASMHKSSSESTISPISTGVTSVDTPRESLIAPIFQGCDKITLDNETSGLGRETRASGTVEKDQPGAAIANAPTLGPLATESSLTEHSRVELGSQVKHERLDDLYFDDGVIDDVSIPSGEPFNEDVFDDNDHGLYGMPLRDRALQRSDTQKSAVAPITAELPRLGKDGAKTQEDDQKDFNEATGGMIAPDADTSAAGDGMFMGDALSKALHDAADRGKFERSSLDEGNSTDELVIDGKEAVTSEELDYGFGRVDDSFDLDDGDIGDDSIVAEANAEALEYDDEGFYGREFGFFAQAGRSNDAEYANGGYFGSQPESDLHRSHSGKAVLQEPSLTPITERSEWSNRNSTAYAMPSMTITQAQVAGMPVEDVNAQLAMLRNLRRGAFGGSESNLRSRSSSHHAVSPRVPAASPHTHSHSQDGIVAGQSGGGELSPEGGLGLNIQNAGFIRGTGGSVVSPPGVRTRPSQRRAVSTTASPQFGGPSLLSQFVKL